MAAAGSIIRRNQSTAARGQPIIRLSADQDDRGRDWNHLEKTFGKYSDCWTNNSGMARVAKRHVQKHA